MLVDTSNLVSVTELGRSLSRYVNDTAETGRRFVILNSNTPTAVLVSIEDLEKLQAADTQAMATAPPPEVEPLTAPGQADLEQRPGMSGVGRDDDGQGMYWSLTEHQFVVGRAGQGAGLLFSAAIAGAVPDPHVRTEFVVATSRSHVALRHERLHPDIAVVAETDLEDRDRRERFLEKLNDEISRRRELLRYHQVDTLAEFRQLGSAVGVDVANLVVVMTDPSALVREGATLGSSTTDPVLPLIAKQGQDLGIYLWIGLPDADRAGHMSLRSDMSQYIPRRYAMGTLDSVAESRLVIGTDSAALAPVPPGTGWARSGVGQVKHFAVVESTSGPGKVVTASGQCLSWAAGLTEPLALADIPEVGVGDDSGLTFPIGITGGLPAVPLTVTVNESTPHLCIIGGPGSGCTTALQTIIAAAGTRYRPRQCTFVVIGATEDQLSQMAAMPNVAGAATAVDTERVERILGEALRIIAIRRAAFVERNVTTLDEYLASTSSDPVAGDPYGRLIVAIDELERLASDYLDQLTKLVQTGGQHGVHLVVTTHNAMVPMQVKSRALCPIRLGGAGIDHETLISPMKRPIRELAKSIPSGQPGRCIDTQGERHGRIALPYPGHYDPQSAGDPAARLQELVAAAGQGDEAADRLTFVATSIAPEDFWGQADAGHIAPAAVESGERRAALDVRIPLGVSIATAAVVDVPDELSPHLLAVGSAGSGRTALIRALIAAIRHRFSPDGADGRPEAKIVLIDGPDGRGELADERAILRRDGYLLGDEGDTDQAVDVVARMITSRVPDADQPPLSARQWRDRTWFQGPEVFVLIDSPAIRPNGGKGLFDAPRWPAMLARLIEERNDLGLHVYAAGSSLGFSSARLTDPLYRSLANVPTLLLSGPQSEGIVWPGSGMRFRNRPAGRGQLVDPSTLNEQVIQIPWYQPE